MSQSPEIPAVLQTNELDFRQQSECDLWSNSTQTWDLLPITSIRQARSQESPPFISLCKAVKQHQKDYAVESIVTHVNHVK